MREIKFRAKDLLTGEWRYSRDNWLEQLFSPKLYDCTGEYPGSNKPSIDPGTVGQFTGMVDRNKREIYEGDILYDHYSNNRFRVYFTRASFDVEGILEADYRHLSDVAINSEVIGNIHNNPELLKE
jgi:uncharacterized phage protein (TIGR01671 family)